MSLDFDALVLQPCHATFGEANRGFPTPQYQPQAGGSFSINGVFRIPSDEILAIGDASGITTRLPEIDFRLALFPSGIVPAQGDIVQIRGVYYVAADVRLDGNGLATLWLRESPLSAPPEVYSTMLRIELGSSATWAPLLTQQTSTAFTLASGQVAQQSISITDNRGTAGTDPITVSGPFNTGGSIVFDQDFQSFDGYWDGVNLVWVVT